MKKLLSIILVLMLVLGIAAGALAQSLTPSVDNTAIKAGESVNVSLTLEEAITNMASATFTVGFNGNLFELTSSSSVSSNLSADLIKGTAPDNYLEINWFDMNLDQTLPAGVIMTLTFIAKSDITGKSQAAFTSDLRECVMVPGTDSPAISADSVSVTVSPAGEDPAPPTPAEGYSVALSQNTSIKLNETADATVTVSNGSEGVTGYNAYRVVLSYDADKLSYEGINLIDASVVNENGTLTITGYGADKTCGTDNIVATFKGIAAGEAKVSITAANIDIKDNASIQDAPAATITADEITITISNEHSVNLKDWFTGNATVADGEDYTFTAKDNHYNYTIAATMGGSSVTAADNGNGTFTIANVTGDLVIDARRTPKTYSVTVTGTGAADVAADASATYLTDYTFTVAKDNAYTYEVSASGYNGAIAVTPNEDGVTYTISGVNVTGNITITVNKTLKPVETTKITFQGEGAADVVGGSEQTANNGQDFSFTLGKKEGYNYTVKLGEDTLEPNADGSYTIPGANISGTDITVTVEKESAVVRAIEVCEYVKLNEKSMFLIIADGKIVDSNVLTYDSNIMFWSEKYNAYAYLVVSDKTLDEIKAEAESKTGEVAAMTTSIEYDGDVNMSGVIDVNDAQLTWNVYNAMYEDFNTVSMEKLLRADVNGDKTVDTKDSTAIIAIVTK